ncbi:hypothetical protein CXB51_035589 [Gossypium anomalum]|uniref:Dolichyl-diphosphooligosaccharide--protein glycosyltransferase subunit 4A n=1 Tax=Gossypium anomalum TaxID=47600 RepID=A0A8J5XPR2_9ROSI|nr:hypothetical protein CXB51_035589 [Gossypium anomalum]
MGGVNVGLDSVSKAVGWNHHCHHQPFNPMIDDEQLGFLANFLGIFIFALVIAYHYVMADPKYEGN